ncbi:four helix bundle protein [Prosthecochloris sp.]|uniref:four helix bundle protein n=1 Tax=Prosthecochloris sp. TaxID=290513 RepID=UPI00339051AE
MGSVAEVETQLELACRLSYVTYSTVETQLQNITEIRRMIQGLIGHLISNKD